MITVTPRLRSREDRAGDPLDGLVNMFDLGIVLSLGFLLAALSALKLSTAFTHQAVNGAPQIHVPQQSQVRPVPVDGKKVIGQGHAVGRVYRLNDGRLVYVVPRRPAR